MVQSHMFKPLPSFQLTPPPSPPFPPLHRQRDRFKGRMQAAEAEAAARAADVTAAAARVERLTADNVKVRAWAGGGRGSPLTM